MFWCEIEEYVFWNLSIWEIIEFSYVILVKKPIRVFIKYVCEITENIFMLQLMRKNRFVYLSSMYVKLPNRFLTTIDERNPIRVCIKYVSEITEQIFWLQLMRIIRFVYLSIWRVKNTNENFHVGVVKLPKFNLLNF